MPTQQVNIHEAKTQLSRLVEQAVAGETIVIAKSGRPLVRLSALGTEQPRAPKRIGFMVEAIRVPEDFDTMGQQELLDAFTRRDAVARA